jgi:hypothetical protein
VRSQVPLLAQHFFWRFLDNDLVSPDSDVHETGGLLLAFLAVPSLLGTALLLFMYANPFVTPYQRLLLSLPDKFGYIAWSMLVMALVTIVDWDALALDARDYAILGPLPIASRTLLAGKVAALALFVAAVVIAVNLVPTLFFPLVYLSSTAAHMSLPLAVWMVLGHAAACVGAAVFAFLAIVGLRSLLLLVLGPRVFRRVSLAVQFGGVIALVVGFFSVSSTTLQRGGAALYWSPPMWFLGLYEVIAARMIPGMPSERVLYDVIGARMLPGMPRDKGLLQSLADREHTAQASYAALEPIFRDLAFVALVALAVAALAAFVLYFAGHLRHVSQLRQAATSQPAIGGPVRRRLDRGARRVLVRDPLSQATFFFTWQTLARSARHKLFLAGYIAAAALLIYTMVAPLIARHATWLLRRPSVPILSLQFVLSFFVLVGLRAVFAIPAELRANWIFRLTAGGDVARYLSGVRRMLGVCVVVPMFALMIPVYWWLYGPRVALWNAGFATIWSLVLVEVLLLGFEKLPFTCSHVSGKGNLKVFWPGYLFAFVIYVFLFASFEAGAMRTSTNAVALLVVLVAGLAGLTAYRRRKLCERTTFIFEELSDATPVRLDL